MKIPGLRRSYDKVGGIVFFGRMLDKIRLKASGRLPSGYNIGTGQFTWFDARCVRFLQVEYDALVARVLDGGSDDEILDWCFREGRRPSEEAIEIWNDFMTKRGWNDGCSRALEEAKARRGFSERSDIQTWFSFHDADEEQVEPDGRPNAAEPPPEFGRP